MLCAAHCCPKRCPSYSRVRAQVFVNTGGVPNGVAFDPNGVVYICDFAHQALLTLGADEDGSDQQLTAIVKDYEGKTLKVRRAKEAHTIGSSEPLLPRDTSLKLAARCSYCCIRDVRRGRIAWLSIARGPCTSRTVVLSEERR